MKNLFCFARKIEMKFFSTLKAKILFYRLPTVTDEDEEYREILVAAGREAAEQLDAAGVPRQIGWTEIWQDTKKHILRDKYGVKWKPPKK